QEILTKTPNNLYSLSNLGVVYFRSGKLKAAELTLKKAVALSPKDEFTHTTLGIVYYRQSKFDEALAELTKSLGLNPKSATMLNFVVDPKIVAPLVPPGTEIDFENGETFLSMVGFLFLDTRLLGLPIPLHRDFEEVNLRFYVRKKSADTWRRGVVFVRELVPRRAIALVARAFYGEKYLALPMKHEIEHVDPKLKV